MAIISDIEGNILDHLEDSRVSPQFWNLQYEIRPLIAEGMCEATLISGEPEVRLAASPYQLTPNSTLFVIPAGSLAVLRMENAATGLAVRKVTVFDLDMDNKGWQNDTAVAVPTEWFPFGLKSFGIHPKVTANLNVVLTVVQFPVTSDPPYTGNEALPFQSEYQDALEKYAAHAARLKEGGIEFDASMMLYEDFLAMMEELSRFGLRKGSLRFSRVMGSPVVVNQVETK